MFDPVINNLPAFASFFATAIVLLGAFMLLYVLVTPYNELALIREGNEAAAISLGGAVVGFSFLAYSCDFVSLLRPNCSCKTSTVEVL